MTSTAETGSSQQTVRVAVAVPLDRTFDYNHSGLGALPRGTIVSVPFGPRQLNGIVLGPGDGAIAATTLKPVTGVAPLPPLPLLPHAVTAPEAQGLSPSGPAAS